MNRQEIYEKVRAHLLSQGERAYEDGEDVNPKCKYRTKSGLKCAIGCLIPDDMYSPDMEGLSIWELFKRFPLEMEKACGVSVTYNDKYFLYTLQHMHDEIPVSEWASALDEYRQSQGLKQ